MALEHGASFEPDEYLATLVLRQLRDVREPGAGVREPRVARRGPDPGGACSGDLTARLTDAHFRQVLCRAGPYLRSLVVNDAPAAFMWRRAVRIRRARRRGAGAHRRAHSSVAVEATITTMNVICDHLVDK